MIENESHEGEGNRPDPEKIVATPASKEQFHALVRELVSQARFHLPPDLLGNEYFEEGYVLDDGRLVWITLSPARTRENAIRGQMRSRKLSRAAAARRVDENFWYEGKPDGENGVILADVEIEKGEQVESYDLRSNGKFTRTYFPGHSEEGKNILDEYSDISQDKIVKLLTSEEPINDPVIDKYVDYFFAQWQKSEDLDDMGFTTATEAEARTINNLLSYLKGDKAAHLMNALEFYQRKFDENPIHLFTEDNPEYLPYRKVLEELKRLQGEEQK